MTTETYNNGTKYQYYYDAEGSLARQEATINGSVSEKYVYDYDSLGRLIHSKELNGSGNMVQRTEHQYDTSNRLTAQNWTFDSGVVATQAYTYNTNDDTLQNLTSTIQFGSTKYTYSVAYDYNGLRQLTRKTTNSAFYRAYAYQAGSETNQTTALVQYMNYRKKSDDSLMLGYKYTYDANGNISAIYPNNASGTSSTADQLYTYDNLGQLTKVVDNAASCTYNYSYDTAGNITSIKSTPTSGTATTKTLTYGDSMWKDRLTKVQVGSTSENITYETAASGYISGNPTSYYNGKHYDFTWQQGRQLATAKVGGVTTKYTYDMAGVRSSKTVGSTTYYFDTLSGLVTRQSWGTKSLYFIYDDSNQPYAIVYMSTPTASPLYYYFVLNQQGDVVGISNAFSKIVVRYTYDPWGAVSVGPDTSACGIGNLNPLLFRSYFYDSETGLYYCQSRYYDPALGRFINADAYASTGQGFIGCNMFAYCVNDPVSNSDPSGYCYYDKNGNWCHDNWEYIGGYERKPDPKAIDITDKLNSAMTENRKQVMNWEFSYGREATVFMFINKVRPGGEWDFKSENSWNLDRNAVYRYKNKILRFDDLGNIHYAYVGSVLFSETELKIAGGIVQIYTGTSDWSYALNYFDEPRDQTMIHYGYHLAREGLG